MSDERFNRIAAFCIAIITTLAAVIAFLQYDASAKDDRANRDTKRYSIEGFGKQLSGEARVNFDIFRVYQAYDEFLVQARSAETRGQDELSTVFEKLADDVRKVSPMLTGKYYDPKAGEPDVAWYEADTYLVEVTRLHQMYKAAAVVKEAWDFKANTYIVHLTLLAVSLFLFGLAVTLSGPSTRMLFVGSGTAVTIWATMWAGSLWAAPVFDLRAVPGAIDAYAAGVGLQHRASDAPGKAGEALQKEAIASFDKAISGSPEYLDALLARAESYLSLGQTETAVKDLERAAAIDPSNANVLGQLGGAYYDLGRFPEALKLTEQALAVRNDEVWMLYQKGLITLAMGQIEPAKAIYTQATGAVASRLAEAAAAKQEPPGELLEEVFEASVDLEELFFAIHDKKGVPPADKITNSEKVAEAADELSDLLNSQEMALEYTGKLPSGQATAEVDEFRFTETVEEGQKEKPASETFAGDLSQISVNFDYSGMKDGQSVIFRIYHDGVEDQSWRIVEPWDGGADGTYEQVLSPGYTDTFTFEPGEYIVEMYVDFHKVQYGSFKVTD